MRKKEKFFWVFLGLLAILSFYFDSEIVRGVSKIRNGLLDEFFLGITFISSEIIIFFVLTSFFLWNEKKRRWILPLWATLILSSAISFLLKILIQRPRPFQLGIVSIAPLIEKASYSIWNFSFISTHAIIAFSAVPILSKEFPKLKYFWIVFAGLVAFSRVYFGLHFLSDVLVGGVIGYLIGLLIVDIKMHGNLFERIEEKMIGGKN